MRGHVPGVVLGLALLHALSRPGLGRHAVAGVDRLGVAAVYFDFVFRPGVPAWRPLVIRWLWNSLARDFSRLPRLSYGKALAAVGLIGSLLAVVLTMIAGARELMTPGAWVKEGLLYKVNAESAGPDSTGQGHRSVAGAKGAAAAAASRPCGTTRPPTKAAFPPRMKRRSIRACGKCPACPACVTSWFRASAWASRRESWSASPPRSPARGWCSTPSGKVALLTSDEIRQRLQSERVAMGFTRVEFLVVRRSSSAFLLACLGIPLRPAAAVCSAG